jgi:hypothetical protein
MILAVKITLVVTPFGKDGKSIAQADQAQEKERFHCCKNCLILNSPQTKRALESVTLQSSSGAGH